jgi:dihydrofolate synthase/folylpolyglutamate synthase
MEYSRARQYLDTLIDWESGERHPGPVGDNLPRMRALLERLGDPQERFHRIIVGGTNGKGTVASLMAHILRDAGSRVGLYSSPHLFTIRERIRVNDEIVSRDDFADAVQNLVDHTVAFEGEGVGPYTRFEAITGMAAAHFAKKGVDVALFEVGLGGRYDATNAMDADLAVITSIDLDHTDVLGNTLEAIAADKFQITRPGRPMVTDTHQLRSVADTIASLAAKEGVPLSIVDPDARSLKDPEGGSTPLVLPEKWAERPATYRRNAALAAGGAHLVASQILNMPLESATVVRSLTNHHWPGRFDVIRRDPTVIIDGAHNPSAARALAQDLRSESSKWDFVVAVNKGHNAAGILAELAPIANRVILTQTGHPRSIQPSDLQAALREGTRHRIEPISIHAVREALESLPIDGHLCVTGSLRLVAHAMEVLGVHHERDGFSEDVHRESMECLLDAARRLGFQLDPVTDDENVLSFRVGLRPIYFLRNKHPFNDYVSARLAEDKSYQHELFQRAGVRMPDTLRVFNPMADARFDRYKTHPTIDSIIAEVEGRFSYPVVVKRNRSSLAQGVHLADRGGLKDRLEEWCRYSGYFDNIFVIQEYLKGPEYRIVASQGELLLAYGKVSDTPPDPSELNPLHEAGGRAEKVTDPILLSDMEDLTRSVAGVIDLGFYAIDLIHTDAGLSILEVNPNPICYFYNASNGREDFTRIYEKLLVKYLSEGALDEGWLLRHVKKAVESGPRAAD